MSLIVASNGLFAQEALYKWDCGGSIGISGYNGEANDGFIFRSPGFSLDLSGRYNFNTRLALNTEIGFMTLSGNTENNENVYPEFRDYHYTSNVYRFDVVGEFNFFPYGIGETYKRLKKWTPFIGLGIGGLMSAVDSKVYGAFQIPFRLGVKMKLKERLNMNVALSVAKVFDDHLDGELADLYSIKSSFFKNTDWYATLTVGLTYEFGERCPTCHRVN